MILQWGLEGVGRADLGNFIKNVEVLHKEANFLWSWIIDLNFPPPFLWSDYYSFGSPYFSRIGEPGGWLIVNFFFFIFHNHNFLWSFVKKASSVQNDKQLKLWSRHRRKYHLCLWENWQNLVCGKWLTKH